MNDNKNNLTKKEIILKGTIIALLVATMSLTAFFLTWAVLGNLLQAVVVGGIAHFIAMGFSLKLSKKFFVKNQD